MLFGVEVFIVELPDGDLLRGRFVLRGVGQLHFQRLRRVRAVSHARDLSGLAERVGVVHAHAVLLQTVLPNVLAFFVSHFVDRHDFSSYSLTLRAKCAIIKGQKKPFVVTGFCVLAPYRWQSVGGFFVAFDVELRQDLHV